MNEATSDREIVISRTFNAPRALVFEAWTDPRHLEKWWGPNGFTTTTKEISFRVGGAWRHVMHGPDGVDCPNLMIYEEIARPERLVYSQGSGEKEQDDAQFHVTVTFEEIDGKTKVTMRSVFKTQAARDHVVNVYGAIEGAVQHLNRLAEFIGTMPIIVERTYNAPIEKVWKAISDKEEMKQWYLNLKEFKLEVGFEFSFQGGPENYLHICKITEVIPGKKLSYSWRFDGHPGDSIVTFELIEEGNKTKMLLTHEGIETFFPETKPEIVREEFREGWEGLMDKSLRKFVEEKS